MCTLSWFHETGGYQVFLNRDERRTRKPEVPPAVREQRGTRFVAPLDGDFGGTWIAVNEAGLTLCLLNGDPPSMPAATSPAGADRGSRGALPLALIHVASVSGAANELRRRELEGFRPFVLLAFSPGSPPLVARWSGDALQVDAESTVGPPLISSSFCTAAVRESRNQVYRQLVERGSGDRVERHLGFHASHLPCEGPASPCMHRDDARTVSFSWVRVAGRSIQFHYAPDSPCRGRPAEAPVTLARTASL